MAEYFLTSSVTLCDAAEAWQLSTQDPATPIMEGMIFFHNYLMFFIIFIGTAVCWLLYIIIIRFNEVVNVMSQRFNHSSILEIIWTIIPAVILVIIAIPSFTLLYSLDELIDASLTLKIIGHQWYWSYELADYAIVNGSSALNFDAYMKNTEDLNTGEFRLLETDQRVFLPTNTHTRLLITSADVLHSWAVPSFGIKVDACPGRLSQVTVFIKRAGVFYGQCSEICGINHGFMPIVVQCVNENLFTAWVTEQLEQA